MQKPRKIPERMCAGCKERRPKRELWRVVRSPQGEVSLDATGKKSGRGAYLCPKNACLAQAKKRGSLARALECAIPDEVYAAMADELARLAPAGEEPCAKPAEKPAAGKAAQKQTGRPASKAAKPAGALE